jgi:rhodanese-related sulfurtransferase
MSEFNELDTQTLTSWMDADKDFVLIDVLSADSYDAHHIPTAISVPVGDENFLDQVTEVADKDDTVVVYCASSDCQASPKAAKKLVNDGYENVYDYDRGLAGWKDADNEMA